MNLSKVIVYLVAFMLAKSWTVAANEMTLEQLFEISKSYSPSIQIKKLDYQIAKFESEGLYATLRPKLSLTSSQFLKDPSNRGISFGDPDSENTTKLSLAQPLYRYGYYDAVSQNETNSKNIVTEELAIKKIELFADLSRAFHGLLRINYELANLKKLSEALEFRIVELRGRANIGRNKKTDYLTAKSQLSKTNAEIARWESSKLQYQKTLSALTGIRPFNHPLKTTNFLDFKIPEKWKSQTSQIPTLKLLSAKSEQLQLQKSIAQSDYYPRFELAANGYLNRPESQLDSYWDLTLTATWDIYTGNKTDAEVKTRIVEMQKITKSIQEQKDLISLTLDSGTQQIEAKKNELKSLKTALQLAEETYKEFQKEYETGLVSNLEVLRSLDDLIIARRTYDQKQVDLAAIIYDLKVAIGDIP